jgi:hypothetical protein
MGNKKNKVKKHQSWQNYLNSIISQEKNTITVRYLPD